MAQREGFEPPDSCPSTVFKTAAFDRSAISAIVFCFQFQVILLSGQLWLSAKSKLNGLTRLAQCASIAIPSLRSSQDRRIRPLCHLCNSILFSISSNFTFGTALAVRKIKIKRFNAIGAMRINRYSVATLLTRPPHSTTLPSLQ